MRLLFFLLLVTGLFASCGSNAVPADIIPGEKMQTIMWQLLQSDEYVNSLVARDTTKKSSTERMKRYQKIFDLNKTSLAEFKKSYHFYIGHPDLTKVMFDSISTKATRERAELYKPKTDSVSARVNMERIQMEKRKTDSIAKAVQRMKMNKSKTDTTAAKNKRTRLRLLHPKIDSTTRPVKK